MTAGTLLPLETLLPKAVAWAEAQYRLALIDGQPLTPAETEIALRVGVAHPEHVRLRLVVSIPRPDDQELRQAAIALKLLGPGTIGMALGYTVFIRQDHRSDGLLAHELRHVHQFEQAGSLDNYLRRYLMELLEFGYRNAPMEIDASARTNLLKGSKL
jgi:hypothetical protein